MRGKEENKEQAERLQYQVLLVKIQNCYLFLEGILICDLLSIQELHNFLLEVNRFETTIAT